MLVWLQLQFLYGTLFLLSSSLLFASMFVQFSTLLLEWTIWIVSGCVLFPVCLEFVPELYLTVSLITEQNLCYLVNDCLSRFIIYYFLPCLFFSSDIQLSVALYVIVLWNKLLSLPDMPLSLLLGLAFKILYNHPLCPEAFFLPA